MSKVAFKRLGDLINLKRGYDLPEKNRINGLYPVISSAGISGAHNDFKVDGQGVITGRYGTLGEVYFIDGKYWPHNTALYVQNFKGNDPKYIYYLLKCLGHIRTSDKSTVPGVNRNEMHEMAVPAIESIEEQKKVREILSVLDQKIELNNRINAQLEAMAKTLYDYWFIQFNFPDDDGKPYKSSGGKMVYSAVLKRDIPEGWHFGSLDELGQIVGGSTPPTIDPDNFIESGTPWITPYDLSLNIGNKFISKGIQDVSVKGIKAASLKQYPAGTVLLSSRAPIGYMAIARNELTTNQGFKSFIPNKGYSSSFIFYTLKGLIKLIEKNASGSTFKEVSAATLKSIVIPLPDKSIAQQFTNIVNTLLKQQDSLEQESENLANLRNFLLPMLMNGQVTVE